MISACDGAAEWSVISLIYHVTNTFFALLAACSIFSDIYTACICMCGIYFYIYVYMYIYIYILCVCVCVCVYVLSSKLTRYMMVPVYTIPCVFDLVLIQRRPRPPREHMVATLSYQPVAGAGA